MTLIKTSVWSAIATMVKMMSGFIVTKIVAVYIGPSGLAYIGQFQNFINLALSFSGGSLSTAITKYTSEYQNDEPAKYRFWSAAFKITLPFSLLFSLFIFLFSNKLSVYIFQSNGFAYIFEVFALVLPLFVINTLLMSILNGHKDIKRYIALNIVSSVISLLMVSALTVYLALDGALLAYVLGPSIVLVITFVFVKKKSWLKIENFNAHFNSFELKKLLGFAVITFTSVTSSAVMMLVVRDYLTESFSIDQAGYWQGVWSLSQVALSLIVMSLSTYMLPTLSNLKDQKLIALELSRGYKIIIPVAIVISLFLYFLREPIILALFTEEFMPMEVLFAWQLFGGVIKAAAWLLGYLVVAKAMVKVVIATEVVFALSFVFFTIIFTGQYGLVGVTHAYALNSLLHLLAMMLVYHSYIKKRSF
jgi:polysaccharide transporter, PST family